MSTPATIRRTARTDRPAPPPAVTLSVGLWLAAILAGFAETLVRLAGEVPPSGTEIAGRAGIYLALAVLVVQLRSGRNVIRWTVVGLLGVIGTLSLVVDPVTAMLAGASPAGFLASASTVELAAAGLRVLHLLAVFAALALLFHAAARTFFRRTGTARTAA